MGPMICIERLPPGAGRRWREIRLRALREAPHAFGITAAEASTWPDARWEAQILEVATFVAVADGRDVGVARGAAHERSDTRELVGMWVDPEIRRRGVAARLIETVAAWARDSGAEHLVLDVVDTNAPAISLYERTGFVPFEGHAMGVRAPGERRFVRALPRGGLERVIAAPTEIRTARLLLRPFHTGDVDDSLAYRNDAEFARFLPHIPQPFTRADAEAFVALNASEPWDRSPTFAVVLGGRVIGTVSFEVDQAKREAMLGYAIGRDWWGQGIAVEATRAAMEWAVSTFGLVRIWASTDPGNLRSMRVLAKLGMTREQEGDEGGTEEPVYSIDMRGGSQAAPTE